MPEISTIQHPDGSVTAIVIEAGRRFESRMSPLEAADTTMALLGAGAASRVGAASGFDVSGAAEWAWQDPGVRAGARESDVRARERWWQGLGKDRRQGVRVNFLVFTRDAPKVSRAEQNKWWERLGKDRRERLRDKYRGGSFLDDALSTAVDVVTLRPVVDPIVQKIPVLRDIHNTVQNATVKLHTAPLNALKSVAQGQRIDKAVMRSFRQQLDAAKALAPYAQTVISFVPGIGTGVSAALGAGLALAEGKPINEAMLAAVRGALPGGAVAQMAFDAATAVMQGKPVEQIALSALPLEPAAKQALMRGAQLARSVAEGKRVDGALLDTALTYLPKQAREAAQVAIAVGSGAMAQKGLAPLAKVIPASVVRGASVTKALDLAAKSLRTVAPAQASKLDATAKLSLASIANGLGAPASAAKLANAAKRAAPAAVLAQANASRKRIEAAFGNGPAPSSPLHKTGGAAEIVALARRGRVRSSTGGAVTPEQLLAAANAGRVFYVER